MPFLPNGATGVFVMWQYINDALKAELNVGNVNGIATPGQGTNPTGRLQTVLTVGESTWPDFNSLPYVGCDPPAVDEQQWAAYAAHQLDLEFHVAAVVNVQATGENVLALGDAWLALQAIVDDGAGNGIAPILRQNVTLGGNADLFRITGMKPGWDKSPAAGSGYIAWVDLTCVARTYAQPGR